MIKEAIKRAIKHHLHKKNLELVGTMPHLRRERRIDVFESYYTNEYIRLSTLDLVAEEIHSKNIPGKVAELGVYRGDFATVINAAFPHKEMYLFDTFSGFHGDEETHDDTQFGLDKERDFTDTSADQVLSKMANKTLCTIREGLFPDTASGLEDERFCFVSIDADLYAPTLSGLQFFYPRLEPGGYIFVHDYNNGRFPGANQAVREFSQQNGIPYAPVTDSRGTAIFCK